jgi:hypothetical protein
MKISAFLCLVSLAGNTLLFADDSSRCKTGRLKVGQAVIIHARTAQVGGSVRVLFAEMGQGVSLCITGEDFPSMSHHWDLSELPDDQTWTDGTLGIELTSTGSALKPYRSKYYVRPDIRFYSEEDFERGIGSWESYPPASNHLFQLELRHRRESIEMWLDGRFLRQVPVEIIGESYRVEVAGGASIVAMEASSDPETKRFLPLDLVANHHRGEVKLSALQFDGTLDNISLPLKVVSTDRQIDVGLARWLRQPLDSSSLYDPYYRRSTWDNLPESILLRLPMRQYHTAHVLCAVDPKESPAMAVRIGRYRRRWNGSGASQADTMVRIDPRDPAGIRSIEMVGTVKLDSQGAARDVPVYWVEIPLRTGQLADYLQWTGLHDGSEDWGEPLDWLTLEFTRTLHDRVNINSGIFETKPLGPKSGIHILGVTLEKCPVEILVSSPEPGYSFYRHENPSLEIHTGNSGATAMSVDMSVDLTDIDGVVQRISRSFEIPVGENVTPFALEFLDFGWWKAEFVFRETDGRVLWRQPLTLALLPPDTRRAGPDSPFGIWWFVGSHYTEPCANRVLPIIRKLGFRHVKPPSSSPQNDERGITPDSFARYGITPSMCSYFRGDDTAEEVQAFFAKWPETQYAMIFHENRLEGLEPGVPYELSGADPVSVVGKHRQPSGEEMSVDQLKDLAKKVASAIRAANPDVKIILGNGTTPFNTFWIRERLSADLWDCVGAEMAVQLFHPEEQPTGWNVQSLWLMNEMKRRYGMENLVTTHCYEVDYRSTAPGALTLKRQAAWYARDVLHALAYRLPTISVGLVADCNSSYFFSRWGAAGVCFRSPSHQPKPSFVSLATLTRMLDRAEYVRWLDLGSTGAYCLEFRQDDHYVYVIWSGRGRRDLTMSCDGADLQGVDSMGRSLKLEQVGSLVQVEINELPSYVVSPEALKSGRIGKPIHDDPTIVDPVTIDSMSNSRTWRIASEGDAAFENYCGYKPMVQGDMRVGRGAESSLRITLSSSVSAPDLAGRYAVLEPVGGPIDIDNQPESLGVWVKGNSNWGRVYFQFEDANGRRWTSNGWRGSSAPGGWDLSDWENEMAINHDGWRLISVKLPSLYPAGYYSPDYRNWRCFGESSKEYTPTYPIRFTRLYIVMREKLVYVTDMVPAKSDAIELKNLCAGHK